MTKLSSTLNHMINTSIVAFFGTLLVVFALVTAQGLEGRFLPVVKNLQLEQVGSMLFKVTGEKARPCEFKELRVQVLNGGLYEKGEVIFVSDKSRAPKSRGLGYQSFGIWQIIPTGDVVKIEAVHKCHPFWETISEIGEFETLKG